jgi:hypothetical protein
LSASSSLRYARALIIILKEDVFKWHTKQYCTPQPRPDYTAEAWIEKISVGFN